jgi:hypothetical protein
MTGFFISMSFLLFFSIRVAKKPCRCILASQIFEPTPAPPFLAPQARPPQAHNFLFLASQIFEPTLPLPQGGEYVFFVER